MGASATEPWRSSTSVHALSAFLAIQNAAASTFAGAKPEVKVSSAPKPVGMTRRSARGVMCSTREMAKRRSGPAVRLHSLKRKMTRLR